MLRISNSRAGLEASGGREQLSAPPPQKAGRFPARVCAVALAALFGAALFWSSRAAAQQSDSQPVAPEKAATAPEKTTATAGQTAPRSSDDIIRQRVNVVNVPVSVLGKNGHPIIDLTQDDFQVFEDGKSQTIKYFLRGTRPPLRIGLILDTSNTARRQLQYQKEAASEFIFNILQGRSSKNQIFLQTYDSSSSIVQDFTNDPEALNEKVLALKAGGGKALFDAIYFACKEKMLKLGAPQDSRRVVVVVSDGVDVQSQHTMEEALSMAHKAETVIYALGNAPFGFANVGDKVLKEMAEDTGGAAFFPRGTEPGTDLETGYLSHGQIGETSQNKGLGASTGIYSAERLIQLADSLDAIGRELIDQYNIGYTPINDRLDGTYRTIHVVVLRKNIQVRAKPGYFATSQQ